jgi:glycosyltransferase involved in cell wall biosynthesis/ribosomal protein S18 acetylase RimI-like enzyme
LKVAHLTTVDLSLRFLVFPQLLAIRALGGEALGISAPGPWVGELEGAGVRHVPLRGSSRGVTPLGDVRAALALWRVLRAERPDILHTHNPKPGVYGRILGRLAGVPIVVNTVHGLYATPDDPIVKRALVYALEAFASRFSDRELVQSAEDVELMLRLRLAPKDRVVHLGNGIDLARFDATGVSGVREEMRRNLDIAPDAVVVGIVGRLVAEKGYLELFEAAAGLDRRFVVLVIGPDDPDKPDALPRSIVDRAAATGVRFLGMRTDMPEIYSAMDVFVLPSHREGFPRAAMEAAAMGLPVIATDVRGCREVVDDGVSGLLIPVGDSARLREAITMLADPRERSQMGAEGRARAAVHFDERAVVGKVLDAYREVAAAKGIVRLTAALSQERQPIIRAAVVTDAPSIAVLHMESIGSGFLPQLGIRFMSLLYHAMIGWDGSVVVVADAGAGPVGFVSGVRRTGDFYRYFLRRFGARALLAALPALLRPSILLRAVETLRYGQGGADDAELLAMAVDASLRRKGVATRLGREFLAAMDASGVPSVRVVVGEENAAAIAAYERLGFAADGDLEIHSGARSKVLRWPG